MSKFTFKEQVRYFEKKLNLPTNSYLDVLGEEHDYFFMVAGANRNEVLLALREAADKMIFDGETLEDFRKHFDDIVAKTGWQYNGGRNWRTRIIYDTNVYGAYNRGRLQQHLDLADVMPYWEYQHNDNSHPRPEHVALDGTIRPASDPFWRFYYPIKAYGCHCAVIAHDEDDLKEMGKTVSPPVEIEMVEKKVGVRTGNPRIVQVPKGYDVGFVPHNFENLNAGRLASVDKVLMQKMVTADPIFASQAVTNLLKQAPIAQLHAKSFKSWVDEISVATKNELKPIDNLKLVGVLPKEVIEKLQAINLAPQSAVISMDKGNLVHALRELKQNAGIVVPLEFWQQLPEKLRNPNAILLQRKEQFKNPEKAVDTLLFVYDTEQGKIAVKMGYDITLNDRVNGKREKAKSNTLITGSLFKDTTGLKSSHYELLWGKLQ